MKNIADEDLDHMEKNPGDTAPLEGKELDKQKISRGQLRKGLIKSFLLTSIAVIVFFVPVVVDGETDVVFGYLYNFLLNLSVPFSLWLFTVMVLANAVTSIYVKLFPERSGRLLDYYGGDTGVHIFFYMLGAVFMSVYALHDSFSGFTGPVWMVGPDTGGTIIPSIVLTVGWIIPLAAVFMPLLLNYGALDFIGSILEPVMRPLFKVPGKSTIDAISSFVSSSSVAILITSSLYRMNVYTKREAIAIATSFSAVSVGFAVLVINTAELSQDFLQVYFSGMLIAFIISFFMIRIPPLSKQPDVYFDGREQTEEERQGEAKFEFGIIPRGFQRAAKRAETARPLGSEVKTSVAGALGVLPRVVAMLASIGITGLIVAEYTPLFNWLGMPFIPLLNILGVPNAAMIAPSIPVGIAEMFLPVLLIAGDLAALEAGAIYFVTTLSLVQIVFFSESIVVIKATRMPVKLWELVVCFFERTLIAIPIIALFMHIMY